MACLITALHLRPSEFVVDHVRVGLTAHHLGLRFNRFLCVRDTGLPIILGIGLIIGIMIRRYLVHVILLGCLLVGRRLSSIVLTAPPLAHVDFLRELSIQLLVAGKLAEVVRSESVCPVYLAGSQRSKLDFVIEVHFNNSD